MFLWKNKKGGNRYEPETRKPFTVPYAEPKPDAVAQPKSRSVPVPFAQPEPKSVVAVKAIMATENRETAVFFMIIVRSTKFPFLFD
jgi:hypothetical protein